MITIADGIQKVQSVYSRGVQSKDTRLTKRHIYSALIGGRATIIQQKSNKGQANSSWAYQTITVELEKVSSAPLSCLPNGGSILRSKYPIPAIIPDMEGEMISRITTIDGSENVGKATSDSIAYKRYSKYMLNKKWAFLERSYLYVTGSILLKAVNIRAAFQDPIEVYQFPNPCDECLQCKCKDITTIEFPIDITGLEIATDIAVQKLLTIFVQMTEDKLNNASEDTGGKAMIHQPQQGE